MREIVKQRSRTPTQKRLSFGQAANSPVIALVAQPDLDTSVLEQPKIPLSDVTSHMCGGDRIVGRVVCVRVRASGFDLSAPFGWQFGLREEGEGDEIYISSIARLRDRS